MYIRVFDTVPQYQILFSFKKNHSFFSLHFSLDNFYHSIFNFFDSVLCLVECPDGSLKDILYL